jgi:hypothetical protein
MGREVKHVPIDFNWPQGKIWYGYAIKKCLDGDEYFKFTCEDCRLFAKLKGMKMTDYDCPVFEALEPPQGDGWQMWETTTEGSPISPVFATPEELAKWLADSEASAMGSQGATYEQWLAMIKVGWAPTGIMQGGEIKSGVEAATDNQ